MKVAGALIVAAVLFAIADPTVRQWDFELDEPGRSPPGFEALRTGGGGRSVWRIAREKDGTHDETVVAQTSGDGLPSTLNLCVASETRHLGLELSVRIKPLSGHAAQGGGLIWRFQDPSNYYFAVVNSMEERVVIGKVVEGETVELTGADAASTIGEWSSLRIVHHCDRIRCYFEGKAIASVADDAFVHAGAVGLLTGADAVTHFDDLSVRPTSAEPPDELVRRRQPNGTILPTSYLPAERLLD